MGLIVLKPQDVVILLKIVALGKNDRIYKQMVPRCRFPQAGNAPIQRHKDLDILPSLLHSDED